MDQRLGLVLSILLLSVFAAPPATAGAPEALAPVAVSPGSEETFAPIDRRCPTFSWGADGDARLWEIAVFAVEEAAAVADGRARRVIARRLPGSVTSWTASGADCLPDGRYAWTIRGRGADGVGGWSPARLFAVASTRPVAGGEVEVLIERYLERRAAAAAGAGEGEPGDADVDATASPPAGRALDGADFSVDGAGNVIGNTFAGDGSGLTGVDAATLGGQDGGFYRAWGNLTGVPAGFADGVDNDTDTLAMLSCASGQVAKRTAAGWECADDDDGLGQLGCGVDEVPQHTGTGWTCTPLTVGNVGAAIPAAPTHLRIGPEHRFPGMRRLAWNMPGLAGVASFVVYRADFPITDANKGSASRQVTTALHAAVDLFPNSGVQHFRVEAQNVLGGSGPLSSELTVDTASRLAYIGDYDGPFQFGLYTVPAVSGAAKTRVSDPFLEYYRWDWSPNASELAYSSNQGTYSGIHVVPASGGPPVRVDDPTAGSLWGFSWRWSPDGSRIAYRANPPGSEFSWQLWTVPATGGSAVRVNDPATTLVAEIPFPAWSPDGSRLLYGGLDPPGPVALFSAPAIGGGATELSATFPPDAAGVERAAWSPDGSRVAYLADQETTGERELWVVAAAGGPPRKINPALTTGGGIWRFAWSPDGTRLVYTADLEGDGVYELFVASAGGGPSLRLDDDLAAGTVVGLFAWSPDGKHVAYSAHLTAEDVTELRVVPAAGGASWRVSPTNSRGEPLDTSGILQAWSPDGAHLAFVADGELYVTALDGADLRKLSGTLVPGGAVAFAGWSPDGSRLVYLADQDTDALQELYLVGIQGGGAVKLNDPFVVPGLMGVNAFSWSPLGN